MNQLPDFDIIPLDNDCSIPNVFNFTNDSAKLRWQEMYRFIELHITKCMNKKDRGDQTILDIKNFTKTLLSNILKKGKYAINKIEMKDNSRYVSTAALKKIAKSTSLNVQHVT